jgi:uncharacterized membrane protein
MLSAFLLVLKSKNHPKQKPKIMKRENLIYDVLCGICIILPLFYLRTVWHELPEEVPVHFNIHGEADRYAGKESLIWLVLGTTLGLYLLLKLIPYIDPKRKLEYMGVKFARLRFITIMFMAVISIFLIVNAASPEQISPNILFLILGVFFVLLGNYFQAIKPNYFFGIRTPWTLESEHVWKKTHRLGGRLWVLGGSLMALVTVVSDEKAMGIVFFTILTVMVAVPILYSFIEFQKEKKHKSLTNTNS